MKPDRHLNQLAGRKPSEHLTEREIALLRELCSGRAIAITEFHPSAQRLAARGLVNLNGSKATITPKGLVLSRNL